ncbi:MAG: hypothetical protein IPP72_03950 [Chitinophagaceae bacterium]|nr:hypothetical protein [Chitinophagaceae bacterium]
MNKILLSVTTVNTKKILYLLLVSALLFGTYSCKKETADPAFTYESAWTVSYNYTTGNTVSGSFKATLKSNGKWDYLEGAFSQTDAGTWTASGNNINFTFSGFGLASYIGTKTSNSSLQGTMVADNGVSTGTWTATR